MEIKRIPLMLFPLSSMRTMGVRFRGIGVKLLSFYPSVRYDLKILGINDLPEHYCTLAFFSALVWGVLLSFFMFALLFVTELPPPVKFMLPILGFLVAFLFAVVIHLAFPKMIAKNIASKVDHELIFVMREMLIQISSGIPFFRVIENVSNSNYEYVGLELKTVVTRVKGGSSVTHELEALAIRTQSDYLKKTSWQMVTAMRSGSNMAATLKGIVRLLVNYQFSLMKSFNAELNFIILIFLMLAAVLPTIGTTVLVIFSVFGVLGVTPEVLSAVVGISFAGQMAIIAYVKTKRPSFF